MNIRAQLDVHLAGIGRGGLMKICAALNVPPPVDEEHYATADNYLLTTVQAHQQTSMSPGVKEAVREAGSSNLTVSGDGSWITRGRTSAHGILRVRVRVCFTRLFQATNDDCFEQGLSCASPDKFRKYSAPNQLSNHIESYESQKRQSNYDPMWR